MSGGTAPSPDPALPFAVVALAASAGGVHALSVVLGALPATLPIPVLVVQHLDPRHETMLADVLSRQTELAVKLADDGDVATAGTAYLAPPDRHLLVGSDDVLSLSAAELVNFVRPSADLLFESAAGAYGDQTVAVVLTGTGRDGAMGARAVKARGGTVIVQDLTSARFGGMPRAAAETAGPDFVLPLDEIGPTVCRLVVPRKTVT